jgi:hypothetical protein
MGMEKLKLLMSYTTFHIGLYTTLGAALVAFLGTNRAGAMKAELIITLACFVLAGACGGIIGSNIPYFDDLDTFSAAKIGPWGFRWIPARELVSLEHFFFWLGIVATLYGLVQVIS